MQPISIRRCGNGSGIRRCGNGSLVTPRWAFHFTPTSVSWLNAVEGFFAKLMRRRLKRGVFCSVAELQAAILRFIDEANHAPKPFVRTANPRKIFVTVN
jgi:hypothetical protein